MERANDKKCIVERVKGFILGVFNLVWGLQRNIRDKIIKKIDQSKVLINFYAIWMNNFWVLIDSDL